MLAFFTPFITGDIDFRYGYVFAGCNIIGGLLIYFFVIEGQGRTLEEIDTMYIQRVNPWHSSKWVAPTPEKIARIRREAHGETGDVPVEKDARRQSLSGETERSSDEMGKEETQGVDNNDK